MIRKSCYLTRKLMSVQRVISKDAIGVVGASICVLMLGIALLAPHIAPYNPLAADMKIRLVAPCAAHVMGTDELGRDVLSRVIYGSRISLLVSISVVSIAFLAGVLLGAVSGFFGGWVDNLIMRVTDVFLAFPALMLAMVVAFAFGPGIRSTVLAMSVVWWPWYARLVRASALSIREHTFVEAARATGVSRGGILFRHILPNCLASSLVQATLDMGYAILTTATLSFLGLGAQPPTPEWGSMINQSRSYLLVAWWTITFPGVGIFITVLGINLLGDAIRDFMDPKLRHVRN